MWYEVKNDEDAMEFMSRMDFFHDSCIKEMKYYSGAFVNEDLSMHPTNDCRTLSVIIQRQFPENPMVEMQFSELRHLRLSPLDTTFTCEILDSTLLWKNSCVYWCDCGGLTIADLENYEGTMVCASGLRWRSFDGYMGQNEFYTSVT